MAFFTEQMEMLTNQLNTSRQERDAFVGDLRQQSSALMADARTFIQGLGQERAAMAAGLRTDLAAAVGVRAHEVKAQRQQNREQRQTMRDGLQETLAQTRRQRREHFAELRIECRTALKELACDLRQAGQAWQRAFQVGASTHGGTKVKVTASAAAAQARPSCNAEKPGNSQGHARNHAAKSKEPTHAATNGSHREKAKKSRHSH